MQAAKKGMDERDLVATLATRIEQSRRTVQDITWFVFEGDIFVIACGDGYLLFAPLQGVVLLLTKPGLAALLLHEDGTLSQALTTSATEIPPTLLKKLDTQGTPPRSPVIDSAQFAPTKLTLSPTAACQLKCEYCYIKGGDRPRHMPWSIAEAAILFVVNNCSAAGQSTMGLMFHGQGEPTANWSLFRESVLFTDTACRARGIEPEFSLVTNGILSESQVCFLAEHRFSVSLSLDSIRESNDRQRPMRDGHSTFDRVTSTMRWLEAHGLNYGIRRDRKSVV